MYFVVTDDYYCDRDEYDTLEEARDAAKDRASDIADEHYPATISMVVPIEEYKYVEPVAPEPTVVCSCVTVRTCAV